MKSSVTREETRRGFIRAASGALFGAAVGAQASRAAQHAEDAPSHKSFDVREFGAKGDGKTFDTPAINAAIDAAAAAGGGTVRVPTGSYLCFSIHLKSKIRLFLSSGATIV